jgi:hypothetical protein
VGGRGSDKRAVGSNGTDPSLQLTAVARLGPGRCGEVLEACCCAFAVTVGLAGRRTVGACAASDGGHDFVRLRLCGDD